MEPTTAPWALCSDDGLSATFQRRGDRWAHRIELPGVDVRLLSVEGGSDERWPAHPPVQHLVREARSTGDVLLGVGMAGRSHWSFALSSTRSGLLFEVACRVAEPAGFLGSTYEVDGEGLAIEGLAIEPHGPSAVDLRAGSATLQVAAERDAQIALTQLDDARPRLTILPSSAGRTVCWQFRVSGPAAPERPLRPD